MIVKTLCRALAAATLLAATAVDAALIQFSFSGTVEYDAINGCVDPVVVVDQELMVGSGDLHGRDPRERGLAKRGCGEERGKFRGERGWCQFHAVRHDEDNVKGCEPAAK